MVKLKITIIVIVSFNLFLLLFIGISYYTKSINEIIYKNDFNQLNNQNNNTLISRRILVSSTSNNNNKTPAIGEIKYIKIYGERNSGLKILKAILQANFNIEFLSVQEQTKGQHEAVIDHIYLRDFPNSFGWRHACGPSKSQLQNANQDILKSTLFITISKNPYAWLLSAYKRSKQYIYPHPNSLQEFTHSRWPARGNLDNYGGCYGDMPYPPNIHPIWRNPMDLWNDKYASYIKLVNNVKYIKLIEYEQILENPNQFVIDLTQQFNLIRKSSHFIPFPLMYITYNNNVNDENIRDFIYYRKYYLNGVWQKEYKPGELINFINENLDKQIMQSFGYTKFSGLPTFFNPII